MLNNKAKPTYLSNNIALGVKMSPQMTAISITWYNTMEAWFDLDYPLRAMFSRYRGNQQ